MATETTKDQDRRGNRQADRGSENSPQRRAADGEVLYVLLEIQRLVEAAREGRLSERVKDNHLTGVSQQMMVSINDLLDAILPPAGKG